MSALPSLSALRAFDAVARHLHFRRAAEELAVSHAAVSQQIRLLEEDLGVRLFDRDRGGVTLTADGRRLAQNVNAAFDLLRDAVERVGRGRNRIAPRLLRITLLPSLASCWLYARLPEWQADHPDMHLELEASTRIVALTSDGNGPEAAIRFGTGEWKGTVAERLCGDWLIAVASPSLLSRAGASTAALFAQAPLLRHEGSNWALWLKTAGSPEMKMRQGPLFRDVGVMLQACKVGQGIALARRTLAADALAAGELVQVHPLTLPTEWANYLVYPAGTPSPAVVKLRGWLRKQMRASGFMQAP